jgi:hypothetical protein
MTYAFQDEIIGLPAIGEVDSAARSPAVPGMFAHAVDPVLGGGEFVYLPGVAGVTAGTLVTYNQTGVGGILSNGTTHGAPVAVAMAAIGAGQYGWFQVSGLANVNKSTSAAAVAGHGVGVSATPGVGADVGAPVSPLASGTLSGAVVAAGALATAAQMQVQLSRPMVA